MNTEKKIASLNRLLTQASEFSAEDSSDPEFKVWKNTVERTLLRVFGAGSPEVGHFNRLPFFFQPMIRYLEEDYSHEDRQAFKRDLEILLSSIKNYIEEVSEYSEDQVDHGQEEGCDRVSKVFVSHSSKDVQFVEEIVEILEVVGLSVPQIFCTSFEGYGIDLGENFLDAIKDELKDEALVLFVLTKNFYASPVCLCEMGASWVQAREHIPILVPPLEFKDIEGVIPLTQGFRINDSLKMNLFKEKVETLFHIKNPISLSSWERKRDRIVARLDEKIAKSI